MKINAENMLQEAKGGFINATDVADYLAARGVPFREAHAVVGRLVLHCIEQGITLEEVPLEQYKEFSSVFDADIFEAISVNACVSRRDVPGGTGTSRVSAALEEARRRHEKNKKYFDSLLKVGLETLLGS